MEIQGTTVTCPICFEEFDPMDHRLTLWAPCCKRKGFFHRDCIQQQALNAGYYFRCPLCNDHEKFGDAMSRFGIFIPARNALWETEPNAFSELRQRHNRCDAHRICPQGRANIVVGTMWELVLCKYCAAKGIHVGCGKLNTSNLNWECYDCTKTFQNVQEASEMNNDTDATP
jgi:hypothetical protein